jgi:protein involved in polysaccharide export with SLBB domain
MPKQCVVALLLFICVLFGSSRSGVAQNESLLIGSGDLVQVDVMDTPEMEQQVRVTDAGTIDLAYIGSVHVAGMPPSAAAAEIRSQLMGKHVMRDPERLGSRGSARSGKLSIDDAAVDLEGACSGRRIERRSRSSH